MNMKRVSSGLMVALLLTAPVVRVQGSSHREALAVLNEPCADNTDTYAWVSNGTHDKIYLIMNFNPLHDRARATRACAHAMAIATNSTLESAPV
jgi:hypothetical protein